MEVSMAEQLMLDQFKKPLGIKPPAPVESAWKEPAPVKQAEPEQLGLFGSSPARKGRRKKN
jgi:hypothetical protein